MGVSYGERGHLLHTLCGGSGGKCLVAAGDALIHLGERGRTSYLRFLSNRTNGVSPPKNSRTTSDYWDISASDPSVVGCPGIAS